MCLPLTTRPNTQDGRGGAQQEQDGYKPWGSGSQGEVVVTHISLGRVGRSWLFPPPQLRVARATHAGRHAEAVGTRSGAGLATGISLGRVGGRQDSGTHQGLAERWVHWRKLQRSSQRGAGKVGGERGKPRGTAETGLTPPGLRSKTPSLPLWR